MPHSVHLTSLEFKTPRTPYSSRFDDIYFAAEQGIDESNYVYIEGSGFAESVKTGAEQITVGEIGFGVGLNFILTLKKFKETAQAHQQLTYISVEQNPILLKDLQKLYSEFPELSPYAQLLLDHYPVLTPGFHWITFPGQPISLLLMLGEATQQYSQLVGSQINHWYWDGHAPSKNPDAFSELLFKEVARLSAPHAKGSSFTSAGWVRRGLESAGFTVEKRPGFGKKRECIFATRTGKAINKNTPYPEHAPYTEHSPLPAWFSSQNLVTAVPTQDRIGVIGAGLAGSAIAQSLSQRGFEVHVIDQTGIASKASGNAAGLFNVQLSKLPNPISRFAQLSLTHFLRELKSHLLPHLKGILRIDADTLTCMDGLEYPPSFFEALNPDQATAVSRVKINQDAVFFPECGIVNPKQLCESRLNGSTLHLGKKVATVLRNDLHSNQRDKHFFSLLDDQDQTIIEVDHLIYATGAETPSTLTWLSEFPIKPVRGQTIQTLSTSESKSLSVTLVDQGYISPLAPSLSGNDHHLIGATYQAKNILPHQTEIDTTTLLTDAQEKWECFKTLKPEHVISTKEGYRASTPDKLPLIGPIPELNWMKTHYEKSLRGKASSTLPPLECRPREWMLLGLGSRGITYSSYGAEILANIMTGTVLPVEADLWQHLHSARFFVRKLRKPDVD